MRGSPNLLKFLVIILLVSFTTANVFAFPVRLYNPPDWLKELESEIFGKPEAGSLLERLERLEGMMIGRFRAGSLDERLSYLDTLLNINQPHDISLFYKIQALEWVLYKKESVDSFKVRLENLEKEVYGTVYAGPFTKRLQRLITQIFPDGTVKGKWASIPDGLLIKVRIIDKLSSATSKPGDWFRFEVIETVTVNNLVLFPKGITGKGILKEVKQPANLGRDARLMLDFTQVRAMDGTIVQMFYGRKAQEMDKSRQWAVGASAAGMLAFGPGGILLGLAIKGKETVIPAGTEFYLQVKEPVRIYTLEI